MGSHSIHSATITKLKRLPKSDRLLESYLAFAPSGFPNFRLAMPLCLKDNLQMRRRMRKTLDVAPRADLVFTDHYESHAASAFLPSPFERPAILTVDGVEDGNRLRVLKQLGFPHSLGLLPVLIVLLLFGPVVFLVPAGLAASIFTLF